MLREFGLILAAIALAEEPYDPPQVGTLPAQVLPEASGIVASRRSPGRFWVHNDGDHPAALFAVRGDGSVEKGLVIRGAENRDWEDIAADGQGQLWIADVGDNLNRHAEHRLYVVDEPGEGTLPDRLPVKRVVRFTYPDRVLTGDTQHNYDSEALFLYQGKPYLISKNRLDAHATLYRVGDPGSDAVQVLQVADQGRDLGMVTAADLSPDGRRLAVLTYAGVWLFDSPTEGDAFFQGRARWLPLRVSTLRQCEGLAWDGEDLLVINEQQAVFRIPAARLP